MEKQQRQLSEVFEENVEAKKSLKYRGDHRLIIDEKTSQEEDEDGVAGDDNNFKYVMIPSNNVQSIGRDSES